MKIFLYPKNRLEPGIKSKWRKVKVVASILLFCYLLIFLYPQILFRHTFEYAGITLHARSPLPAEVISVLTDAHNKIESSSLYRKQDRFNVFICNSETLFRLMAPLASSSFAVSYPLTDNIFVARADVPANKSRTCRTTNVRKLSSVIAHECTHVLIARQCGRQTAYLKPKWLQEGYCEYIAASSALPECRGDAWIRGEWKAKGLPLDYHLWRRMVEYLVSEEKQDINKLMMTPPEYPDVLLKTRNWLTAETNK